jgi:hypothetical protein
MKNSLHRSKLYFSGQTFVKILLPKENAATDAMLYFGHLLVNYIIWNAT